MFGRSKSEVGTPAPVVKEGGKGRPTPKRREAEAAAKARAKPPKTRKEKAEARRNQEKALNSRVSANQPSSKEIRAGMRAGVEKYQLPRDKGPVRRFTRDFVDRRFSFVEMMIPLLIVTMIMGYSGNDQLASTGNSILIMMVVVIGIDIVLIRRSLFKEVGRRFPEATTKGLTYYAVTRALQMKFMRLPKAQVKIGEPLPDTYR